MAHTLDEKKKLLVRVNRIQGQLQSIREAIEEELANQRVGARLADGPVVRFQDDEAQSDEARGHEEIDFAALDVADEHSRARALAL